MNKSQVAEITRNKVLDTETNKSVQIVVMKAGLKKHKVPRAVQFLPDEREKKIIEAAYEKRNLKKAQDVISAALLRYAESEGLELAS